MHHETQAGAYLQQIESHRRLVTEGRERLQEAERQLAQARSLAVELENELAALTDAHEHTLTACHQAGMELCECRPTYPKHVRGVPGCLQLDAEQVAA